jgi:hypothetical protein
MRSFDSGRNWYGWEEGRRIHFIEDRRGWSNLWKGRLAYDADSLRACSAEPPFGSMQCGGGPRLRARPPWTRPWRSKCSTRRATKLAMISSTRGRASGLVY